MSEQVDLHTITGIIAALEEAANSADPGLSEAVTWLDDPRFSEIEDFIPEPFGANVVREISAWIRENGEPGDHIHFEKVRVYMLAPTVAYATALQHLKFDTESTSRVTFVFLKKDDDWGVIHGHYSGMPAADE